MPHRPPLDRAIGRPRSLDLGAASDALHADALRGALRSRAKTVVSAAAVRRFREAVWRHYRMHGRSFPWRDTRDPYEILVSEIMLQQTQTNRVREYFTRFLERFPSFASLARARSGSVIRQWQGLGYNRRALALHRLARVVVGEYGGVLPTDRDALRALPGIGLYTAVAVRAFVWNEPETVVETNIRSAVIYFFFPERTGVSEQEIAAIVQATVDRRSPREWYYALMDYGVWAKSERRDIIRRWADYRPQSRFRGSDRELRGAAIRYLVKKRSCSKREMERILGGAVVRVRKILNALVREGFIELRAGKFIFSRSLRGAS